MTNIYTRYFGFISLLVLLSGCANQLPPGGGEVDRIPPKIVSVFPEDGTINYHEKYFELEFSEYVDKRSFKDAVFISPAIDGNLEFDWSGRSVRVYFPAQLKDSVTYVVTIGTDVVDLNNRNRMAQSLVFSFSTGTQIDKRIVTGKAYTDKPSGLMIFAYNIARTQPDPLKNKPDYISQTGTDGSYKLAGLAKGTYRIFAVKDEFRDLLFQPEQDQIGIPSNDITFAETDTIYEGMDFFLTSIDTAAPRLLTAVMTDKNHILASFTEPLDSTLIIPSNFYLFDSTANKKSGFIYAYKGNQKPNEAVLVLKDTIADKNSIYFFTGTIKDKTGNAYQKDEVILITTSRADTVKPDFLKSVPANNSPDVDFLNPVFTFYLNDAIDLNILPKALTFKDTSGNSIPCTIKMLDNASFNLFPAKLEPKKNYVVKINMRMLPDIAGNRRDSTYEFNYKTITGLDFTGVNGKLVNTNAKNIKIELKSTEAGKNYTQTVQNNRFDFIRILPGKYILWAYTDADSNGTYSKGSLQPFKYSETFNFHTDTLQLRSRWSQSDVIFNYNKK